MVGQQRRRELPDWLPSGSGFPATLARYRSRALPAADFQCAQHAQDDADFWVRLAIRSSDPATCASAASADAEYLIPPPHARARAEREGENEREGPRLSDSSVSLEEAQL